MVVHLEYAVPVQPDFLEYRLILKAYRNNFIKLTQGNKRNNLHAKNVRTVPLITCLQTGQSGKLAAHAEQLMRCPHGKNTIFTSRSIQILQSLACLSMRFSSSKE